MPPNVVTTQAKRALILGASCDIGLAICSTLMQQGMHVTATVRSEKAAERVRQVESAEAQGQPEAKGALSILHYNLGEHMSDGADANTLEQLIASLPEPPHYVVDCMQENLEGYLSSLAPEDIAAYCHNNITMRAQLIQALTRHMLAHRKKLGRGKLIFISSTAAVLPNAGQGIYAAAKQAGEALYKNIGIELGARGITTCSLRAGYVDGGRGRDYIANHPEALQRIPTRQAATPEEIAATVSFLLSDAARNINATSITLDGGLTACK